MERRKKEREGKGVDIEGRFLSPGRVVVCGKGR